MARSLAETIRVRSEIRWLAGASIWFLVAALSFWLTNPLRDAVIRRNLGRWRSLSTAEREQVLENLRSFRSMAPDEQRALQELASAAFGGPPGLRAQRLQVIRNYVSWKKALPLDLRNRLDAAPAAELAKTLEEVASEWRLRQRTRPYWFTLFGPPPDLSDPELTPEEIARLDEELPVQRMFLLGGRRPGPPRRGGPRLPIERLSPAERAEAVRLLQQLRSLFDQREGSRPLDRDTSDGPPRWPGRFGRDRRR